ncbi:MAG: CsgG/HfaB family protein [Pseudomonadota bacterium]
MRYNIVRTGAVVLVCAWITGCAAAGSLGSIGALGDIATAITGAEGAGTSVSGRSTVQSDYSGPRARVAVLRFTDATGGRATGYRWYSREVGDSMSRKLTSALLATKRFKMVQRKNMSDLMTEINFGASGAVDAGSASRFGQMVGARLIVTAAITDFEDSGGSRGGAGGSSGKGLLGVIGGAKKTYMAINLEVVDVQTSEIIASEQIDATVRDVDFGALLCRSSRSGALVGGLSGWDKEPKGKALQKIINAATQYLEESIPQRYYTESPV